jgi:pyruvate kinase
MSIKILSTLGPSSLNRETVQGLAENGVSLFRINLSHTLLEDVQNTILRIQSWTDIPICLDSEGAQIRNGFMTNGGAFYEMNDFVHIHREAVEGDRSNISFTPESIFLQLEVGDEIRVDFNSVLFSVTEKHTDFLVAKVNHGGHVGSNKGVVVSRTLILEPITPKDRVAFRIGLTMGITNYALSFTNCAHDVSLVREIIGDSNLISKIESINGVLNLKEILPLVDQILIDRGDLSREIPIAKIPFIQRSIISYAKKHQVSVYIATNLLESMINSSMPTRAEANDVASTLLMGASGLVLAAETAIGNYPVESVRVINDIIHQFEQWKPSTSFQELISFE